MEANATPNTDSRLVYILAAILAVIGGVTLSVSAIPGRWGTLGAGGLLAFAAFCGGGLMGALFGIPRAARASDKVLNANNNLAEVSDWLTKVLLGATLTQLRAVPGALTAFGAKYGQQVGGEGIAVFLLVGFSCGGFFIAYLFTRIVLQHPIYRADQKPGQSKGDEPIEVESFNPSPADGTKEPAPPEESIDEKSGKEP